MDERLKSALDVANRMTTFNNMKDLIKQEYKESCLYHESGHRFTVDRDIISFLTALLEMGHEEDIVILDDFENPYIIKNVKEFRDNAVSAYFTAANNYYYQYNDLKKKRSIESITGI